MRGSKVSRAAIGGLGWMVYWRGAKCRGREFVVRICELVGFKARAIVDSRVCVQKDLVVEVIVLSCGVEDYNVALQ